MPPRAEAIPTVARVRTRAIAAIFFFMDFLLLIVVLMIRKVVTFSIHPLVGDVCRHRPISCL
jgi:hypothetical protein